GWAQSRGLLNDPASTGGVPSSEVRAEVAKDAEKVARYFDYIRTVVGDDNEALRRTRETFKSRKTAERKTAEERIAEEDDEAAQLRGRLEGSRVLGAGVVSWRAVQANRVVGEALDMLERGRPLGWVEVEKLTLDAFPHITTGGEGAAAKPA